MGTFTSFVLLQSMYGSQHSNARSAVHYHNTMCRAPLKGTIVCTSWRNFCHDIVDVELPSNLPSARFVNNSFHSCSLRKPRIVFNSQPLIVMRE
ncbi:hypothetical protein CEXT_189741 [Caerostris extrusa]|uniref:Secreted protein n=1 Tax=Caerostris extrusa TaxID=172846 RepID=A0AAV4XUJ6_CAEEX|nr:hypothetical protein CEXT_189741 [Caerostris extrusa]